MLGKALRSKHIYINEIDDPIDGYLLLQCEKIEKIVPFKATTPQKISENYKIYDYLDNYIFPGLIDANIHTNSTYEDSWNDAQNLTKMASQGGITTLIDGPLMQRTDDSQAQTISLRMASLSNKIFVDVGLLAYLDQKYFELLNSGVLGFKGYLSPPFQSSIPKLNLHALYKIKKSLESLASPCVLCLNCEEANERDLFVASPLRAYEKKTRLDSKVDIKDFRAFGGGHQGTLNEDASSSTSNLNEEENDQVFDMMIEANRIRNNGSDVKSPTTADLKVFSFVEAIKQDEKYISEQEYNQYQQAHEESKDFFEEDRTLESLNLDSSLNISKDISQDFSNNTIDDNMEEKDEKSFEVIKKPGKKLFEDNPLKKLFLGSINTEKEIGSKEREMGREREKEEKCSLSNLPYSKYEIDSEKDLMKKSEISYEEYAGKNYSESPEMQKKKEGILERRLKSRTLIENDFFLPKKSSTSDPKNFMLIKRINTVKDTNPEAKEEEKKRCRVYKNFLFNHPLAWETSGVHLLLKVFKNANNCNILLTNLSSSSLAYIIRDEKKKNPNSPFFVDTSIPYIFFSMDMIKDSQTKFKTSPPIRDKAEANLIVKSIRKGVFDTISSFHLQTPLTFKNIQNGNFRRAFNGISCLGFNLPAVWTRLYAFEKKKMIKGKLVKSDIEKNLNRIFRILIRTMSKRPAEIFNINHQKGDLMVGKDADILIWNPFVLKKIDREDILLKYPKLFIFRGYKVYGEVVATFLRGEIVFQKGKDGKDFVQRGRVLKRGVNI